MVSIDINERVCNYINNRLCELETAIENDKARIQKLDHIARFNELLELKKYIQDQNIAYYFEKLNDF